MNYISTRGETAPKPFNEVLLMGLVPDGGLMLPESYPQISRGTLNEWRNLSYPKLAFEIMSLFVTDIPADDLRGIIGRTYTKAVFNSKEITPVRTLSGGLKIQALSDGPTLTFKDMTMQFLGNTFEYVLDKEGRHLNILGATSSDTGSAAEYALRGEKGTNVFMLSPEGKVSAFQRAQMYSLQDANTRNITVKGMFDDCQDIIKAAQSNAGFKATYHIDTVNSINWGRIVTQVVYYFAGYFKATQSNGEKVSFCVPNGNFGNICAGHIAKQMGLPVGRLIAVINENDVLDEFFKTGRYLPRSAAQTHVTSSPSMDISKASNFERFVFDLVERDTDRVNALQAEVASGKGSGLSGLLGTVRGKYGFVSGKSLHNDRLVTIKRVYEQDGQLIDPYTADGVKAARELHETGETVVCLETALAVKFEATIHEAVGDVAVPRPVGLGGLEGLPQRMEVMADDAELVKNVIEKAVSV